MGNNTSGVTIIVESLLLPSEGQTHQAHFRFSHKWNDTCDGDEDFLLGQVLRGRVKEGMTLTMATSTFGSIVQ